MYSKHNIFSKIRNSDNYFIINLLSKNADILKPALAESYREGALNDAELQAFREKGYVVEEEAEAALFKREYLDFIEARDTSEVQLFFVPTYACNFACSYCYQNLYSAPTSKLETEVVDAFFSYIDSRFAGRNKYITLFGGEPLLPASEYREVISYFIETTTRRNLGLAVVTNGYHLSSYLDELEKSALREIQVTLDGTEELHNSRRPLRNGGGTFRRIVGGVDDALSRGMPVNLRIVVDKENVDGLPALAKFASSRGWTGDKNFKTQLGRNYELHDCQARPEKLFDRIELYEKIYSLAADHPEIMELHRPAYSVSRFLFDNGELPTPLFDGCPGCKTEWAFDYTGGIYSCTATVGKKGEELGAFYPRVTLEEDIVEQWEDRDVLSIPECGECSVRLACGGGCAAVAKNRANTIHAPDCRPVKELLELGMSVYFENEKSEV